MFDKRCPTSISCTSSHVVAVVKISSGAGGRTIDEKTMTRRWQGLNVVEEDICFRYIRKKYTGRSLYNQGCRVHHLFVIALSFFRHVVTSSHHFPPRHYRYNGSIVLFLAFENLREVVRW